MSRRIVALLLLAMICLMVAAPAFASEEGKNEEPANTTLGWIFRWINFAIVALSLGYLLVKKAPAFFRGRAAKIVSEISDSKQIKEEADRRLREAEEKLARLDKEVAELRVTAKKDAQAEAERIRLLAQEEERKVQRAGQAEMEAAERAARMELKAMAAQLAVKRAEALIRKQMTPEAQAGLVKAFVENLN